ncbi:MAG: hypothetical protein NVS3B3_09070 [Aquirhabdus sp.]
MVENMEINALATRALLSCRQAVMASQSGSVPGFPFTSVIPVGVALSGQVIALLGETAQHTRNIMIDSRVSMLLHDDLEDNWQAATRLSVLGRMIPLQVSALKLEQLRRSFYLLHPELTDFDLEPNYHFWQLEPVRFRFLSISEKAQWLDQINPDLFNLTEIDRSQVNTLLAQHHHLCHVVQAGRYGVQIITNGRVLFLVFAHPVNDIHELLEQIKAQQYQYPAKIV